MLNISIDSYNLFVCETSNYGEIHSMEEFFDVMSNLDESAEIRSRILANKKHFNLADEYFYVNDQTNAFSHSLYSSDDPEELMIMADEYMEEYPEEATNEKLSKMLQTVDLENLTEDSKDSEILEAAADRLECWNSLFWNDEEDYMQFEGTPLNQSVINSWIDQLSK